MRKPPRYKTSIVIWLAIYPLVTLAQLLLGPWLNRFPLPVATLILTFLLVPLMTYVMIPLLERLLERWLKP